MRTCIAFLLLASFAHAEIHSMTLPEAARRALEQSPAVMLARIAGQKALEEVRLARDPFFPKIFVGSGLAYSTGFPMSIEGAAPSIVQARGVASIYNRRQKFQWKAAEESQRGATIDARQQREAAVAETVDLFLEAEKRPRALDPLRRQLDSARRIRQIVGSRVEAGREIALEDRRAALEVARIEKQIFDLELARDEAESTLAVVLGFPAGDRVRAEGGERAQPVVPESIGEAVRLAAETDTGLRRLESALAAQTFRVEAERSARYPQLDLVAQYALFGRFNNYEDFFRRFQRHNGQLGVSIQLPLLAGPAARALEAQASAEAARLRIETDRTRGRVRLDAEQRFHALQKAESARNVARLELDLAREELAVEMARVEAGRSTIRQLEQIRLQEQTRWLAWLESHYAVERLKYALLERTGGLLAALQL
jgi:outer membrane protein TolC